MPCYDPPPPFEGEARESAEHSSRLLCGLIATKIANRHHVDKELLEWWVTHREIDAKVAVDNHYGRNNQQDADAALRDVAIAKKMLDNMVDDE